MNRSNRHMQYRKRIMRKRRIRLALIISAVVLVLLAIGFLVFGNLLFQKNQPDEDSDTEQETDALWEQKQLPSIQARPALLETKNDPSTWNSRLSALKETGTTAVSTPLNQPDGTLLFHSPTALELGRGNTEYAVTVSNAVSRANNHDLYVCGVWTITAPQTKDARLRSVRYAEEAAIIAEALDNGLHDVLLILPSWNTADPTELLAFEAQIRSLCTSGNLGFCLPNDLFDASDYEVWIDELVHCFDYLALNGTEYGEQEPAAHVETVASRHLDLLLRYKMRLLLPSLEETEAQDAVIAAAEQYNAKSWQILQP